MFVSFHYYFGSTKTCSAVSFLTAYWLFIRELKEAPVLMVHQEKKEGGELKVQPPIQTAER